MANIVSPYRNGTPPNIEGFVRITRATGFLKAMWTRLTTNSTSYAKIDGEFLSIHDSNGEPARKQYTLTGAHVDYDFSGRWNLDFTITLGRRQLLVVCERIDVVRKWTKAVESAAKRSFEKFYILGENVRRHAYGATYLCYDANNVKLEFDVDIIRTDEYSSRKALVAVEAERRACAMLKSDYINSAVDIFRNASEAHFVRHKSGDGGNIVEFIRLAGTIAPAESEAYAFGVALKTLYALKHMHSRCLAHRDIRPETILLKNGKIVIGGLGASAPYPAEAVDDNVFDSRDAFAKPPYAAPEIMTGAWYGPKADIWALGAVVYEVICGRPPPATGEGQRFSEEVWRGVRPQCKTLVRQLLNPVMRLRLTAEGALEHDWICLGLNLVPQFRFRPSNSPAGDAPTVIAMIEQGLPEVRRQNPILFDQVYRNVQVQDYLSKVLRRRRTFIVQNRALVVVFRLMRSSNLKLRRRR